MERATTSGGSRPDDTGLTLAELSVTMLILGILTTAVMVLVNGSERLAVQNTTRVDQINTGRTAVEAMSKSLRTAVLPSQVGATCPDGAPETDPRCVLAASEAAFLQGTATSVQFYGNLDNVNNTIGPSRVTYTVTGGTLVETIQAPDAHAPDSFAYRYCDPGPSCPVRTRTLATGVLTASPIFTYYDASGARINRTTLTATDLEKVDAVDIVVTVKTASAVGAPPTTFVQRVALPNADSVFRNDAA
jgi:prepilin-type N-terminal cleavage/methylation domain-containing protein